MEAEHGIAIAGVLAAEVEDRLTRLEVDAGHEHLRDACLTGTGHYLVKVGSELLTIQMTMCIDKGEHHDWRFIIWAIYWRRMVLRSSGSCTRSRY